MSNDYIEKRELIDLSIAKDADNSTATRLGSGKSLCGLDLPDDFEALTAYLIITGGVSFDGTSPTMKPLKDRTGLVIAQTEIAVDTSSNSRIVPLDPATFWSCDWITITAYKADKSTKVTQATAARAIYGIPVVQ